MNTTRKIARNTAILTLAEIVSAIISLFFTMYVARYLGAEGFGTLSFALAFIAIFGVFTDIGLNQLMTREVARDKTLASKYLGNVINLKAILAIVTFGLITLTINLLSYPEQTKIVVYFIAGFLVVNTFSVMYYSIFQAYERMEFITLGRVVNALLLLFGALFAVSQGLSVTAFALVYFLSSTASLLFNIAISLWKFAKPKIDIDFGFWKETLKQAWPFGLAGVFSGIYFWIDSVMLSFMKGNEVVGWYNAAYRLVFVLTVIPGVYFTSAFPAMSKYYVTSKESLKLIYEKSIKYMIILAVPIAVGTSLLADKAIMLIFDPGYSNSIIALQILVWAVAFVFISSGFARLFESTNKQLIVTIVAGACAILNVVLNLILIPRYSYIGASAATVTTEFTALTILFIWSFRIGYGISGKKIIDIVVKTLAAGAVMGLLVFKLRDLAIWVLIPLSALLYFIVLFIIRAIDGEDIVLFKQMVRRQPTEANIIEEDSSTSDSTGE
ncbi:MAG: flippase [Dehalococcoidales bacterium]|nr:flippase [Dehalococcoidales bacterium]